MTRIGLARIELVRIGFVRVTFGGIRSGIELVGLGADKVGLVRWWDSADGLVRRAGGGSGGDHRRPGLGDSRDRVLDRRAGFGICAVRGSDRRRAGARMAESIRTGESRVKQWNHGFDLLTGVEDAVVGSGLGQCGPERGDGIESNGKEFAGIAQAELVEEARGRREFVEIFGELRADLEEAVSDGFTGEAMFFHLFFDDGLEDGIRVKVALSCGLQVAGCRFRERTIRAMAIGADEAGKDGGGLEGRVKLDTEGLLARGGRTLAGFWIGTYRPAPASWGVGAF